MNIDAIKHIIIVPATDETAADPTLMARLVDQMGHYSGCSFAILRADPCGDNIRKTANHITSAIMGRCDLTNSFSDFVYNSPENTETLASRLAAKAHFDAALKAGNPPAEVMVLVVEPQIAPVMTLAILIDTLGCTSIHPRMVPVIEAGGAATVDCVRKSRYVLHPEGNEDVVRQCAFGGRQLRPAK